jgi:hypothetical protein
MIFVRGENIDSVSLDLGLRSLLSHFCCNLFVNLFFLLRLLRLFSKFFGLSEFDLFLEICEPRFYLLKFLFSI